MNYYGSEGVGKFAFCTIKCMWLIVSPFMCLFTKLMHSSDMVDGQLQFTTLSNITSLSLIISFHWLTGDTYTLPAEHKPLHFAHKASLLPHRALHVIIVSLCGCGTLWGRISGDFPQVLRNMNVRSQQISLGGWWVRESESWQWFALAMYKSPFSNTLDNCGHTIFIAVCVCEFDFSVHNSGWWNCECHTHSRQNQEEEIMWDTFQKLLLPKNVFIVIVDLKRKWGIHS